MFKVIFNKPTTRPLPDSSSLRKSFSRRQRLARDERGITLQTLIVTAVLVLVAVAAGVILVAISRSQESSLTDSGKSDPGEGTCEPWEINDIELKAKQLGGPQGYGGIWSSAVGCVRVCYVQTRWADSGASPSYRVIPAGGTAGDPAGLELLLGFSHSDVRQTRGTGLYTTYQIVSSTELGLSTSRTVDATDGGRQTTTNENEEIRVHASQEFCHLVDTANDDEEIARSDLTYSGLGRAPENFVYQ